MTNISTLLALGALLFVASRGAEGEVDQFAATGKFDANGVEKHSFEAACVLSLANRASQRALDPVPRTTMPWASRRLSRLARTLVELPSPAARKSA